MSSTYRSFGSTLPPITFSWPSNNLTTLQQTTKGEYHLSVVCNFHILWFLYYHFIWYKLKWNDNENDNKNERELPVQMCLIDDTRIFNTFLRIFSIEFLAIFLPLCDEMSFFPFRNEDVVRSYTHLSTIQIFAPSFVKTIWNECRKQKFFKQTQSTNQVIRWTAISTAFPFNSLSMIQGHFPPNSKSTCFFTNKQPNISWFSVSVLIFQ